MPLLQGYDKVRSLADARQFVDSNYVAGKFVVPNYLTQNQVSQSYSREVIKAVAAQYQWSLQQQDQNNFVIQRAY